MPKPRRLKVAKESDPIPGRPEHIAPEVWATHGDVARAKKRSDEFVRRIFNDRRDK